jgi:metal-responsive CopG/Arc/MetJ family transcriptional regulator
MKKIKKEETIQISLRLPVRVLEEIDGLAEKEHRNRNNTIVSLILRALPSPEDFHDP